MTKRPSAPTLALLLSPFVSFFLFSLFPFHGPQFCALFAIPLIYLSFKHRHWPLILFFSSLIITTFIFQTGQLDSPIFFLLYFLLFGISLFYSPKSSLYYTIIIAVLLSPSLNHPLHLVTLSSLFFISPLAIVFGNQYLSLLVKREQIVDLRREKAKDRENQFQEETDILLWLSLHLKPRLSNMQERVARLLTDLSRLSPLQREELTLLRRDFRRIKKNLSLISRRFEKK